MKKIILASFLVLMVSSAAWAVGGARVIGVNARSMAMGGVGIALANDISAAYYNPAGLLSGAHGDLILSGATRTDGLDQLLNVASSVNNPETFFTDNFANTINVNGKLQGIVGGSVQKIGLSVIPTGSLAVSKTANSVDGSISASFGYDTVITLGKTFGTPFLPFASTNVGANIKFITANSGSYASSYVAGPTGTATEEVITGSGFAIDLGATAKIPYMTVGVVIKDIAGTVNTTATTTNYTVVATTGATSAAAPSTATGSTPRPLTIGIGAAGEVPVLGLKAAMDIESVGASGATGAYTVTHIGFEYPMMMGVLPIRLGFASAPNSSMVTWGFGFNLFVAECAFAMTSDSLDASNNAAMFSAKFGI